MSQRDGLTQIHLRLPKALVKKVEKQAKKEHRNRTQMIVVLLERALENETKK